jgi:hypothetical protein
MKVLKSSELKVRTAAILDQAQRSPVFVEHNGTTLMIANVELVLTRREKLHSPWNLRAGTIESFYDPGEAW